jgi:hypothetical protein
MRMLVRVSGLSKASEIRDYTIEAEWFDGHHGLVAGSTRAVSLNGQPNVCWIIQWPSREARDEGYVVFTQNPEWIEIWSKHPNPHVYLQTNVRFMQPVV